MAAREVVEFSTLSLPEETDVFVPQPVRRSCATSGIAQHRVRLLRASRQPGRGVETVNFDGSTWLDGDGSFHSDALRVVERFTRKGSIIPQ